ncbi:YajQ family cyclic di-GMP-binding protein [PVC group bacterium (ex Bugula neritina AB1)]|nr:YajQ family cyclic di-GMP-binding protein [PVC group bacterium (ex Bugula neritina AB1)]
MSSSFSFDIFSEIDQQEIVNAINQSNKEHSQRFDLKNSNSNIEFKKEDSSVVITSSDEYKLKSVVEILKSKFVKRGISLKAVDLGKLEDAQGGTVRQILTFQEGIPSDKAKQIVKDIKAMKIKVQAQIMDQKVRISSAKKDLLQEVMQLIKEKDYDIHLEFGNYR